MRAKSSLFVLLAVVLIGSVASPSSQAADPLIGKWRRNESKSTYSPGPPPKGTAVRTFESPHGLIVVHLEGTNAQGQTNHQMILAKYDGKDYPIVPANGETTTWIAYKRVNANVTEYVTKVNGKTTAMATRTVAPDGRTMTIQIKGTSPQGQAFTNTEVWDKQ